MYFLALLNALILSAYILEHLSTQRYDWPIQWFLVFRSDKLLHESEVRPVNFKLKLQTPIALISYMVCVNFSCRLGFRLLAYWTEL